MRGSLSASERHDRKRAEHKRYYAQTAFKSFTNHQALDEVHLEPTLAIAQGGI